MSVVLLPVLALVGLAAVVFVVVVVVLVATAASPPTEAAAAGRRHGALITTAAWCTLVVGLPLVLVAARNDGQTGAGVAAAAALLTVGAVYVGLHAVGERTWPRPQGRIRRASLVARDTGSAAPAWLRATALAWTVALAAAAAVAVLADTDAPVAVGGPMLATALLVIAAGEATVRLVARRPVVVEADPGYDAASRRLAGQRVLRGVQLVAAVALTATLSAWSVEGAGAADPILAIAVAVVPLAALVVAVVPARPPVPARPVAPGTWAAPTAPVVPAGPATPTTER